MRPLPLLALLLLPSPSAAQPIDAEFFERKVRPVLLANCTNCHGAEKQKGGLRLDSREALLKGGDTGPAVVEKDAAKSALVQAVKYDGDTKMPPKGKLADADIDTLAAWVNGGAPWPADVAKAAGGKNEAFDVAARAKAHWSFQPVKQVAPPGKGNPIDAFLLVKLSDNGLSFAPPAEKRVLVRRLYFDLVGLPPTPEEVAAFVNDASPDAYEKLVEKLLASPHYGERWGRHWLDLVRYAETHGHEFDFEIPDAWRYRDYVVRALNADVPFDRFVTEHLAGDLLPGPRRHPKDGANESILGTGFWFLHEAKHSPVDSRADQADRIDNMIDVFGKAVLGLTVSCARCHDHKFDPIATKDYYALFGVLTSARYQRAVIDDEAGTVKVLDAIRAGREQANPDRKGGGDRTPSLALRVRPEQQAADGWRAKSAAFERFDAGWRTRWDAAGLGLRPEAGDGHPHTGREAGRLVAALRSPTFVIDKPFVAVKVAGKGAKARLVLNGLQLIQAPIYGGLAQPIDHGDDLRWLTFDVRMWGGQAAYLEFLDDGPGYFAVAEAWFADAPPPAEPGPKVEVPPVHDLEAKIPDPRRSPAMRDAAGRNERVFIRGNHKTPGVEAPRAFLEAFGKPAFTGHGSGRLELAKAVTDPANPLVARVLVNRLWKHHFGEGLVRSPDDFGKLGQEPTHLELLDWLAGELVAGGWSIKAMHRVMVNSAAYKQASRATPQAAERDPQNKLLHRQSVRRLEAEAIRDAILVVSGRLDRTLEGPGVLPHLTEHQVGRGRPASGPLDGNGRRSIYLQVRRNFLNPMFAAFDYPTPFTTIGRRSVSNVPAQALVLLNNPFVLQQAELWARRVLAAPGRTDRDRIVEMYRAAFGRDPEAGEVADALEFVKGGGAEAWADLAHVLLNAKEFVFVE
jgi:hypothetical protein